MLEVTPWHSDLLVSVRCHCCTIRSNSKRDSHVTCEVLLLFLRFSPFLRIFSRILKPASAIHTRATGCWLGRPPNRHCRVRKLMTPQNVSAQVSIYKEYTMNSVFALLRAPSQCWELWGTVIILLRGGHDVLTEESRRYMVCLRYLVVHKSWVHNWILDELYVRVMCGSHCLLPRFFPDIVAKKFASEESTWSRSIHGVLEAILRGLESRAVLETMSRSLIYLGRWLPII